MLTPARFLWAKLQLDWICEQRGDGDILEELERLPLDLCETYDRILDRINQQPPKLREVARKALMWVLYALRPLQPLELREAIAIEPSMKTHKDLRTKLRDVEIIISSTRGLLTVESAFDYFTSSVRPIHASVQEYLTRTYEERTKPHISEFFIDEEFAHSQIAKSCMTYLQLDIFKYGPSLDEITLQQRACDAALTCYSPFFFDKHIQYLDPLPQEIYTQIDLVLNSEECTLAAILQCRRLRGSIYNYIQSFSQLPSAVNAATLIYSSDLYNILQTYRPDSNWLKLPPLKYNLHQAAANNAVDAMQRLVELGQEINELDEDDTTPLYHASINCHIASTKWLLEHDAQANMQCGDYGTALQAASYRGYLPTVELLLKHSANVNLQGGEFDTALQAASYRGYLPIVELLLKHNADVNLQGGKFDTALQAASYRGQLPIVEILLKHNADVNLQGGKFDTALQAASYGGHLLIVELLLKHNANVNLQGGKFDTALQVASYRKHLPIVELLLKDNADVNLQGGYHNTALQAASYTGYLPIVELLLKYGAEIASASLEAACGPYYRDNAVARLLLEKGAEVTAKALENASLYEWDGRYQMLLGVSRDSNIWP
jgi:ankyrin repeat protein